MGAERTVVAVDFRHSDVCMEGAIVIVIVSALLAPVVWTVAFMVLGQRPLPGAIPAPHQDNDNLVQQRLPNVRLPSVEVITGSGWGPGSYRIDLVQAESRADAYLRTFSSQQSDTFYGCNPSGRVYRL